jgi:hypothetical protein
MDLHRLAEERSIALHREVAAVLAREPERVAVARARMQGWLDSGRLHPRYAQAWLRLLDGPREALLAFLVDPGEEARAMRQCTPFAGVLDPRTRWRIWREVRETMEESA